MRSRMLDRLAASDDDGIAGGCVAEILDVFLHLGNDTGHRLAGLGPRRLAQNVEHLLEAIDMSLALTAWSENAFLSIGSFAAFADYLHAFTARFSAQ